MNKNIYEFPNMKKHRLNHIENHNTLDISSIAFSVIVILALCVGILVGLILQTVSVYASCSAQKTWSSVVFVFLKSEGIICRPKTK